MFHIRKPKMFGEITILPPSLQGKHAEAEQLYQRCQMIEEKVLGPEHQSLGTTFNNQAMLLSAQVRAGRKFL